MRASGRLRGSVPGRMKVTTLNLMTACRAKVSLSPLASSLRWRIAQGDNATHLPQRPTADCSDRLCATHDLRPPAFTPTGDFPPPRENTGKTGFQATLEAAQMPVSH